MNKKKDTIEELNLEPLTTSLDNKEVLFISKDFYLEEFELEHKMNVIRCTPSNPSVSEQLGVTDDQIKHNRIWILKYLYCTNTYNPKFLSLKNLFYFRNYNKIMDGVFRFVDDENLVDHILNISSDFSICMDILYFWVTEYFDGILGFSNKRYIENSNLESFIIKLIKDRKIYRIKIDFYSTYRKNLSSMYWYDRKKYTDNLKNKSDFSKLIINTKEKIIREAGLINTDNNAILWSWKHALDRSFRTLDDMILYMQKRNTIDNHISTIKIKFDRYTGNEKAFDMIRIELPLATGGKSKPELIEWIKSNKELLDDYVLFNIYSSAKFKSFGVPINILKLTNFVLSVDNVLLYTFEIKIPTIPE